MLVLRCLCEIWFIFLFNVVNLLVINFEKRIIKNKEINKFVVIILNVKNDILFGILKIFFLEKKEIIFK